MFDSKECEWADLALFINGAYVAKIQEIQYRKAQEKEFLYAAGNEPRGIQRGNKSYDGQMVLLKNAVDDINRAVFAAGGEDITDASYLVVASYAPKGTRIQQSDSLLGLEFTEEARSIAQNQKSMPVTLPFMFLQKKST